MEFLTQNILTILIFLPVAGAVWLWVFSSHNPAAVRRSALLIAAATFVVAISATMLYTHDVNKTGPKPANSLYLVNKHVWIGEDQGPIQVQYHVGVDGISLPLILLAALLTPLAIWSSFTFIKDRVKEYYSLLLLLFGAMLGVFCARDLLLFYVFFEFTLIPLFFIIGIWGSTQRRKAADMFFLYTFAGSVLTFAAVLYLGYQAFVHLTDASGRHVLTFELDQLYRLAAEGHLSTTQQTWLFLAFFAGFAIKVPLFPVHTWLPLAHTEAPAAGSVILAGVLLKLGTYGFLRMSVPMLPTAVVQCAGWMGVLAVVGIIYGALAAWVQTDMKKLVAYSSVSHLGYCILGIFSLKMAGLSGALLYMVNHGLSTGALFLTVGMIYERYHTREMANFGGLARKMPIMAFFLIFFTLSSIGLPGLNGFIGEFLVLLGTFISHARQRGSPAGPLGPAFAVAAATGIVLGAVYMLHLCRRVLFGPLHEPEGHEHHAHEPGALPVDLNAREIAILTPIAVLCLLIGLAPKPIFEMMQPPLQTQVLARVEPAMEDREFARDDTLRPAIAADRRTELVKQTGAPARSTAEIGSLPAFEPRAAAIPREGTH